jgi:site-specific DNA-methyltransferase (adenine-specific)
LGILERIVRVHSNPGDTVLDFFAGSGTTGVAALRNGRSAILIDQSPEACTLMRTRLAEPTLPAKKQRPGQ